MEIYITTEVDELIASLEDVIIAKVLRTIDLLEKFGNQLRLPHSKAIGKGLFELRIRGYKEIRIFMASIKIELFYFMAVLRNPLVFLEKNLI